MKKISLITMPAMEVNRPSISLTQMKSRVESELGDRVEAHILYLNHDFARYMNEGRDPGAPDLYETLLDYQTGVADWFFRQIAFPDAKDNAEGYFRRCYPGKAKQEWKEVILRKRRGLVGFLDAVIDEYRIGDSVIVGFTSMFAQNVASFALAQRLKERSPRVTVVIGGANCETPMGQEIVKNVAQVDYVFSGPGLVNFVEFTQHLLDGEVEQGAALKGIFSKFSPDRERSEQIGEELSLDVPVDLDYSDFFASLDRNFPGDQPSSIVLFETSRGCWWGERSHCTFCGLNGLGMNYRAMAADNAVEQFQTLFDRYGSRTLAYHSVDNIMPRNYVKDVLPRINTPEGAHVFYEVKADLKEETLRVMAESGVSIIQPGIESLATSTLALMKKGTTAFVNLRLLKMCLKYGVDPRWNLLVGFPGEGEEVYEKYVADLPSLIHLPRPQLAAPVRFDRYSPYLMEAKEYGLKLRSFDFYKLVYPFDDETLQRMAYYFIDTNFEAAYIKAAAKWIGKVGQRVEQWNERWNEGNGLGSPKLELNTSGGSAVVRDSRLGEEVEHDVSGVRLRLLDFLERPRKLRELMQFGESEGCDIERELAFFDQRGLIWREGERCMSLVMGVGVPAELAS